MNGIGCENSGASFDRFEVGDLCLEGKKEVQSL